MKGKDLQQSPPHPPSQHVFSCCHITVNQKTDLLSLEEKNELYIIVSTLMQFFSHLHLETDRPGTHWSCLLMFC